MSESVITPPVQPAGKREPMARFIDASSRDKESRRSVQRRENTEIFPISPGQRRMWLLDQFEKGTHYNENLHLRLKGTISVPVLNRVLHEIMRRHEAMRAIFFFTEGELRQRIAPLSTLGIPVIDLRRHPESDREAEAQRLATEEVRKPFDLSTGPLWRFTLLRMAEDDSILLVTAHHIAVDGWSFGVFRKEFAVLYDAFSAGQPSPLPETAVQYSDYAAWLTEWLASEEGQKQREYWVQRLAGAPQLLELPADHPRPTAKTFHGARYSFALSTELTTGVKALSIRASVTPFMTFLAAFTTLIQRYTAREDVVVGSPVANRVDPAIEGLIGFFVNTLALRNDLSENPTFSELLHRVRNTMLDALEHQIAPFDELVDALHPMRTESYSPIVQVLVVYAKSMAAMKDFAGLSCSRFEIENHTSKFDIMLNIIDRPEGFFCSFEYSTDLFNADRIERMAAHLRVLLEDAVRDPGQRIADLEILPPDERHRLLVELNDTAEEYASERCAHQLFEDQAGRTPNATAVTFEGQKLSYAELNRRANQLAHFLRGLGVKPDTRVAICLERGLEMVVALLAVLKAGGAYVPLDPAYPTDRLRFILEDSQPIALLTQRQLRDILPSVDDNLSILDLTAENRAWSHHSPSNPEVGEIGIKPNHLAYIIYTSGSTGQPKGVMVEHANVARLFKATDQWFHFNAEDVWTLFHSYAFDFSVWEIWGALLYGGRLVVVPKNIARSPGEFYELLCREGVTVLNQTPSAFRQLITAQSASHASHRLRYVVFGGEALELATLKPWYAQNRNGQTQLINMYGITETTVHVTYRPLEQGDTERRGASPIGCRIPDLRTYILDPHGQPVPVGIVGELYVGGAGVARGYLNRPELTAQRFLPDPFTSEPRARMYRSGDLARRLADGLMEYLGRNDFQVKIRGFRIELGEIEARLAEYPGVNEVVVIAREDTPGDKRLVAYYTTAEEQDAVGAEQFRQHLTANLPEYMVPAAYVLMEAFPLTPNGKLDRKALPAPDETAFSAHGYEPPQGELEVALAEAWAEVLKLERIGRHDNFFELGGHSFLAVQLMLRLQKIIPGEALPLRSLLEAPTVERFAVWLQGEEIRQPRILVQIQAGSPTVSPFFFVSAPNGTVLGMRPLAMALDKDIPLYCIQHKGLDGSERFGTVEEAARCYIDGVRKVQPQGPYCLGGYCFGGVVAFEMAHMLEQSGESVAMLFLIDSFNPAYVRFRPTVEVLARLTRFCIRRAAFHMRRMRRLRPGAWIGYSAGRLHAFKTHGRRIVKSISADHKALGTPPVVTSHFEEVLHSMKLWGLSIQRKFVPQPYGGDAIVFRGSEHNAGHYDDDFLGWKPVVRGKIQSFEIESDHDSIFRDPAVRPIAEKINARFKGGVEPHGQQTGSEPIDRLEGAGTNVQAPMGNA